MKIKYNVIIQKEEKWYVSKCIENSVISQGKTVEESLKKFKRSNWIILWNRRASWTKRSTNRICIIPMHYEVARGTLKGILEQADIELEEFLNHL